MHGSCLKSLIISVEMGTDQSERTLTMNNLSSHTVYWLNISSGNVAGVSTAILNHEAKSLELRMAELRGGVLVPEDFVELSHQTLTVYLQCYVLHSDTW